MVTAGRPYRAVWIFVLATTFLGSALNTLNYPSNCFAQEAVNGRTSGSAAPAVSPGDIELTASRVFIFVDKTGLGHQHAVEGQLAPSKLLLGTEKTAGRLVFDMKSFDADTLRARQYLGLEGETDEGTRKQVNSNMKGRDVLDTAKYPQAIFDVERALPTGKTNPKGAPEYEISGLFTLHGVQKPVTFLAYAEQAKGWIHLKGDFGIKQTTFGMKPYSKAFGAVGVTDALRIYGDLWVAPSEQIDIKTLPAGR